MPSCEGRQLFRKMLCKVFKFQFMPSCEGRRSSEKCSAKFSSFNSCPLARADDMKGAIIIAVKVSIHALLRGQTTLSRYFFEKSLVSIHALLRGQTKIYKLFKVRFWFQFMPSCEGRRVTGISSSRFSEFQFMPSCEGRQYDAV